MLITTSATWTIGEDEEGMLTFETLMVVVAERVGEFVVGCALLFDNLENSQPWAEGSPARYSLLPRFGSGPGLRVVR
jgi:hypothetical protein